MIRKILIYINSVPPFSGHTVNLSTRVMCVSWLKGPLDLSLPRLKCSNLFNIPEGNRYVNDRTFDQKSGFQNWTVIEQGEFGIRFFFKIFYHSYDNIF